MPFNGLNSPEGVAADAAGAVYVTDSMNGRVLKLTAG
jgi:serine/threonine-protein kinase